MNIPSILAEIPEFDENKMYPFYEKGVHTKEQIREYLVSWFRKGYRPEITFEDNFEIFEVISLFKRAGYDHYIFVNKYCNHFIFVIREYDFIKLVEGHTYNELIDNIVNFYSKNWNIQNKS